jgi:hypothetical protein
VGLGEGVAVSVGVSVKYMVKVGEGVEVEVKVGEGVKVPVGAWGEPGAVIWAQPAGAARRANSSTQ